MRSILVESFQTILKGTSKGPDFKSNYLVPPLQCWGWKKDPRGAPALKAIASCRLFKVGGWKNNFAHPLQCWRFEPCNSQHWRGTAEGNHGTKIKKNEFGLNYEKHKIFLLAAIIGLRLNIIDEAGSIFIQCRLKLKTGVSHSSQLQLMPVRQRPVAAVPSPAVPHVPPALTNCVS